VPGSAVLTPPLAVSGRPPSPPPIPLATTDLRGSSSEGKPPLEMDKAVLSPGGLPLAGTMMLAILFARGFISVMEAFFFCAGRVIPGSREDDIVVVAVVDVDAFASAYMISTSHIIMCKSDVSESSNDMFVFGGFFFVFMCV